MTIFTKRLIDQALLTAEGMLTRAERLREIALRLKPVHALMGQELGQEAASLAYRAGELGGAALKAQENPHSTGPFTVEPATSSGIYMARVLTADGDTLCDVRAAGPRNMSINESIGNADHIAMCLNTHEALVKALTPLAETPTTDETPGVHTDPDNDAMIYAARAAIAATRGAS